MEQKIIDNLLKYRYLWVLFSVICTVLLTLGGKNLYLETDYKIYFNEDDPQRVAHEGMEQSYTKTDNLAFIIKAKEGDIFTQRNLGIIVDLTEQAWQTPFVIRVDSLTNFQHTVAEQDDLAVADLVEDPDLLNNADLQRIKDIALNEKQLRNRLISKDAKTAMVNVSLELPAGVDPAADFEAQAQQRAVVDASHPEVVRFARTVKEELLADYPGLEIHLIGVPIINNSFSEMSQQDGTTLVPAMYAIIILLLAVCLRSLGSIVGTVILIGCASAAAVGSAGWIGMAINTVTIISPTVILMIAVCDAVHLLTIYLRSLASQMSPLESMRESLRLNFQPIILTSITTAVGFLTLNFSISPPIRELGTISAIGVMWAMVLTFTLLPTLTMLLVRKRSPQKQQSLALNRWAKLITDKRKPFLIGTSLVTLGIIALIPLNLIDDDPSAYFKPGVPYRDAVDFQVDNLPNINDYHYSVDCGSPGCVNDPEFLAKIDHFSDWLAEQPEVEFVTTYADVMKRLNRSMNGDKQSYYAVPESAELAAQYNLMYEMSLPYGLDLNNQINIDKSATRISVYASQITTGEFIALEQRSYNWLKNTYSELASPGASVSLMFSHLGEKNIRALIWGGLIAILGVTLTILIALRSFRYALISMVPNLFPALLAFGVWGLVVGRINFAVAAVFSICLGILVDDTVHFISKYRHARQRKGFTPEQAIEYAFNNVGTALVITTVVLVLGFSLLNISQFNLNAMTGQLTALTIGIALIFDFIMLPIILLLVDKDPAKQSEDANIANVNSPIKE